MFSEFANFSKYNIITTDSKEKEGAAQRNEDSFEDPGGKEGPGGIEACADGQRIRPESRLGAFS